MATRVGFSTSKTSWVSKIIRWFTAGRTSHTFLVYHDSDWGREMVMEATQGGYRIVPFEHYKNSLVAIFTPKHSIDVGLAKSVDWLGENYDYKGLFGMAWVELGRWLKRKWRNPWQSSTSMFCSEAVVRVLQGSSYPGAEQFDPGSTDPETLLRFFEKEAGG
jgi:hypothetical protein